MNYGTELVVRGKFNDYSLEERNFTSSNENASYTWICYCPNDVALALCKYAPLYYNKTEDIKI